MKINKQKLTTKNQNDNFAFCFQFSSLISHLPERFDFDFVKHRLAAQRFGEQFGFSAIENLRRGAAGDFKHAVVNQPDFQIAQGNSADGLDFFKIMQPKPAVFLDVFFDKRVAQGVFSFFDGEIIAFDD